mmetsp:Transcript_29437/g.85458  ORF Transcript_29437/g.85458 Transcript_29437/m.85458 type:complete len:371 (-) Transcript_29437:193-1305(-)
MSARAWLGKRCNLSTTNGSILMNRSITGRDNAPEMPPSSLPPKERAQARATVANSWGSKVSQVRAQRGAMAATAARTAACLGCVLDRDQSEVAVCDGRSSIPRKAFADAATKLSSKQPSVAKAHIRLQRSAALNTVSCCVALRLTSDIKRSSRTPSIAYDHATLLSSAHCAVLSAPVMCAATRRNRASSENCAAPKAQTIMTRQRKLNNSVLVEMWLALAWNKGVAFWRAGGSMDPIFAKAQRTAESSNGLKTAMWRKDIRAAARKISMSGHCIVANDHVMLLSAWQCGEACPISALAKAARVQASKPWITGRCDIGICGVVKELAFIFASRCRAVDRFTKFMSGKKLSIFARRASKSPRSATWTIWALM